MSNHMSGTDFDDYISQAQAARMRAVTRQAIADLVKRGRLRSVKLAGRNFVLRSELEAFFQLAKGRPMKDGPKRKMPEPIYLGKSHELGRDSLSR